MSALKATRATAVDGALAYTADGRKAAVRGTGSRAICIVDVGAQQRAKRICPRLKTVVNSVAFSPDGRTLAVARDGAVDFKGGLWLISAADGSVRKVATPTPSGSADSTRRKYTFYRAVTWPATGGPIATALLPKGKASVEHLVRIDPDTARPKDLGAVGGNGVFGTGTPVIAGHTAVIGAATGKGAPQLRTVDLESGTSRSVPLKGTLRAPGAQIRALAVSPDGKKAVVSTANPATYQYSPPTQVDLATGATRTVGRATTGVATVGAAYSPDGSELAFLTDDAKQNRGELVVAPAGGGSARSLLRLPRITASAIGLRWTSEGLLLPTKSPEARDLGGLPPIELTG